MFDYSIKYLVFVEPAPLVELGEWEGYNFNHDYFRLIEKLPARKYFKQINNVTGVFILEKF